MIDQKPVDYTNKANFCFISMIRQPEYVTKELFDLAKKRVANKKKLDVSKASLVEYTEGLCVQCLHIGKFDDEPKTILKMTEFTNANNLLEDFSDFRLHHEIYLSDPRKVDQSKMRTILRQPVRIKV